MEVKGPKSGAATQLTSPPPSQAGQGPSALRSQAPPTLDEQLKKVSKMYEKQFLDEMMRAMRKTTTGVGITEPSMAEKIYTDELYDQYTDKWADSGGNGLADQIYKELKEKILPSQHSRYLPTAPAPATTTKKVVK